MIIDVTDASFEADVLQRSKTTPVVVDLWAPWCGPCRTLTPILEKVVGETDGRVVLAKVNVDENPQVSQAFQVQGIPAVFAIAGGEVVSNFTGAQPEPQVRAFVDALLEAAGGDGGDDIGELIAAGDEESLVRALEIDPSSIQARLMLAQIMVTGDRHMEAIGVLEAAPEPAPELEAALAAVRQAALPATELDRIESRLAELLGNVKGDDDARQEYVELLESLNAGSPDSATTWRKKLSSALY